MPLRAAAVVIAVISLYRGLCLLHEISHLRLGSLRGFETAWNLLIGVPLLMPSFIYGASHLDHHKSATYGTLADPEYLPFARGRGRIVAFMVENALMPFVLPIRFLLGSVIGLAIPPVHRFLETHASTLCFNHDYRRTVSPAERSSMKRWEAVMVVGWAATTWLLWDHGVLVQTLMVLAAAFEAIAIINALRTLAAHRYRGDGTTMNREQQLLDSVDITRGLATTIWAPIGLRYHAMHHYFPGVPYHHLRHLHTRVMAQLAEDGAYRRAICPSVSRSLLTLWSGEHRSATASGPDESAPPPTAQNAPTVAGTA